MGNNGIPAVMVPLVLCLVFPYMGGRVAAQFPVNEIDQSAVFGQKTGDHCALCYASQASATWAQSLQVQESQVSSLQNTVDEQHSLISSLQNTVEQQQSLITSVQSQLHSQMQVIQILQGRPRDCSELLREGYDSSGIYTIYPFFNDVQQRGRSIGVYCDMQTDGGGWTVFQRRQDGSEDFYLGWADYKAGFGKLDGEFWLGNDKIHQLTNQAQYELRVDLEDFEGNSAFAQYRVFTVGSESEQYRLTVGNYTGTAGDAMDLHSNGRGFSTKDRDNSDGSCAQTYKGAWWYGACHNANLNGLYHAGSHTSYADGVNWIQWKGHNYSLKHTEMKMRPIVN